MKMFTRDADAKPDTPLSVWVGMTFILLAFVLIASKIGPGPFDLPRWQVGLILVTALLVFFPGLHTPALWLFTLSVLGVLVARLVTRGPQDLDMGIPMFMLLTGLVALVPGLLLTVARDPA